MQAVHTREARTLPVENALYDLIVLKPVALYINWPTMNDGPNVWRYDYERYSQQEIKELDDCAVRGYHPVSTQFSFEINGEGYFTEPWDTWLSIQHIMVRLGYKYVGRAPYYAGPFFVNVDGDQFRVVFRRELKDYHVVGDTADECGEFTQRVNDALGRREIIYTYRYSPRCWCVCRRGKLDHFSENLDQSFRFFTRSK